jgi:hypothetical protein
MPKLAPMRIPIGRPTKPCFACTYGTGKSLDAAKFQ